MKVAYNGCYGGFSLSPFAETIYQELKGLTLTWYEGIGRYPYTSYKKIDDIESYKNSSIFGLSPSKVDLGENPKEIPNEHYYYNEWADEDRSDPDLIAVIEKLGEKANGMCANLCIEEIPDGAEYEIDEYDGFESVVPPRWRW